MSTPTNEEVEQLVSAFQKLKTWPKADSAEELVEWMTNYVQSTPGSSKVGFPASITLNQPPKLPFFSGDSKCETTFDVWKHQYNC